MLPVKTGTCTKASAADEISLLRPVICDSVYIRSLQYSRLAEGQERRRMEGEFVGRKRKNWGIREREWGREIRERVAGREAEG